MGCAGDGAASRAPGSGARHPTVIDPTQAAVTMALGAVLRRANLRRPGCDGQKAAAGSHVSPHRGSCAQTQSSLRRLRKLVCAARAAISHDVPGQDFEIAPPFYGLLPDLTAVGEVAYCRGIGDCLSLPGSSARLC